MDWFPDAPSDQIPENMREHFMGGLGDHVVDDEGGEEDGDDEAMLIGF